MNYKNMMYSTTIALAITRKSAFSAQDRFRIINSEVQREPKMSSSTWTNGLKIHRLGQNNKIIFSKH